MLNLVTGTLGGVFAFALVVVVARGLGPSGTGVFFESVGLFTIASVALELGAQMGLVRFVSRYRELGTVDDLRRLCFVAIAPVIVAGAVAAAALLLLAPTLATLLFSEAHQGEAISYLRILAPFIPLAAGASVALGATRGFGTMLPFVVVRNLGKPLLRPLLTAAAIVAGMGSTAIALAWAIPAGIEFPVALIAVLVLLRRSEATSRPDGRSAARPVGALVGEFWRFAAPRGLSSLFQMAVLWLGVLMVGALASTREAGIYAAVTRCVLLGTLAIEAVRLAIAPQLSALLARGEKARAEGLYQVATWWLMLPSWPAYLLVGIFAPVVLKLFGGGFASGQDALLILSLAMLVNIGTGNVTVVLLMAGKSSWNLYNTLVSLALNVGLNLLLIPRYGITGAAIAWAISILWDNLAPLVQVWRLLGLAPWGPGYLPVALSAILVFGPVGLASRLLLGSTVLSLVVAAVVATALYVLVVGRWRHTLQLTLLRDALRVRRRERPQADGSAADLRPQARSGVPST
jgi:O-antigen/teichoic acid export membrane protein